MNKYHQWTRQDGTVVNRSVDSIKRVIGPDGKSTLYINLEGNYSYQRKLSLNEAGKLIWVWTNGQQPSAEQRAQVDDLLRRVLGRADASLAAGDWQKLAINARWNMVVSPRRYTRDEINSGRADEDMDFAGPNALGRF